MYFSISESLYKDHIPNWCSHYPRKQTTQCAKWDVPEYKLRTKPLTTNRHINLQCRHVTTIRFMRRNNNAKTQKTPNITSDRGAFDKSIGWGQPPWSGSFTLSRRMSALLRVGTSYLGSSALHPQRLVKKSDKEVESAGSAARVCVARTQRLPATRLIPTYPSLLYLLYQRLRSL